MTEPLNRETLRAYYTGRRFGGFDDGYGRMEALAPVWRPLASWGRDGWDLGGWPFVVFYVTGPKVSGQDDAPGPFRLMTDVEGDLDTYSFPTAELRRAAIDYLFGWYAVNDAQPWAAGWNPEDASTIPAKFRGPYRDDPATQAERAAERAAAGDEPPREPVFPQV